MEPILAAGDEPGVEVDGEAAGGLAAALEGGMVLAAALGVTAAALVVTAAALDVVAAALDAVVLAATALVVLLLEVEVAVALEDVPTELADRV